MNKLPDTIYLQCPINTELEKCKYPKCNCENGITWSEDKINDSDVGYKKIGLKK